MVRHRTSIIRAAIVAALTIAAALPTSALTGSSPHRIAKDVTTTLCGDANCDGQVDFSDSIAILQHLGNKDKYQLSETGRANADVDGVAGVTANDAKCIQEFVAGVLPDLGGQTGIGTPQADLGAVRLLMGDYYGPGNVTCRPGESVDVCVYADRTDMRLGGIFLRLGGELPKGVDVYMDDNYAYAFDGNKEYFQVGNFFLCDTLQSGDPQEVDSTQALLQFQLRLPADLKSGEYRISPIDFCQLFSDGTSHIYDVTYSPLVLCVPEEGGGTSPDPDPDPPDPDPDPPVPYLDPTDAAHPTKTCTSYTIYGGETTLASGWWVVSGAVTNTGRIAVSGDAHLILKDGAELAAGAGIRVAQGDSLTVWAQSDGDGMGALTAVGSTKFNAGIGGDENLSAGTVTINGGRVNASARQGAGIGGGGAYNADATAGAGGTVTIRGGTVSASSTFGSAIGGGSASAVGTNGGAGGAVAILGGTVTVSVGSGYAQSVGHGYDTGSRDSGSLGIADGMRVFASANATEPVAATNRENACRGGWAKVEACQHEYSPDGVCLYCGKIAPYAGQTTLAGGLYEVDADWTVDDRIEVQGDVLLILCDGVELTASQGFHVTGTNSLTISARSANRATAGKLTIPGPDNYEAGIGGNDGEAGGTVTVNGGVLDVAGGRKSGAIGGGRGGAGCMVMVNGGFVTATGGLLGAGIGGGDGGAGGRLVVHGGTVAATGGEFGAGIGGGDGGIGGTVTIAGGTVTAIAGTGAQAIGHGDEGGNAGSLAIDGMRVFASPSSAPVAAADRVGTCRSGWAKVEACPHGGDGGSCPWCGLVLAYAAWAGTNGVAGAWDATDASGVHNVFRYLFDKPSGAFENPPILSISFDASGRAVIHTPPLSPSATGFEISILATDDLAGTGGTTYPLDADGETTIPASDKPARFFRLQAVEK